MLNGAAAPSTCGGVAGTGPDRRFRTVTTNPGQNSSADPVRILITGGGTGGHVYPGLAVAEALLALAPRVEPRFVGTRKGLEAILVPRAGHRFVTVPASGVRGLGGWARLLFLVNFLAGFLRSLALILAWRPAVVLGTGGYVIAPVMAAARVLGVRCVLQEQNAVPGSANRLVARWAERIFLGFGAAAGYFPEGRTVVTGNPVRAAFGAPAIGVGEGDEFLANAPAGGRVLVFGGSGGARTLNRALDGRPGLWLGNPERTLWIQTGRSDLAEVEAAFGKATPGRVRIVPYIQDMARALAWADLVVSRSGAMTLAELQALGKPAILVPFPHATDDHQLHNAEDCARAGAALVIPDDRCTPETLCAAVDELLSDPGRLAAMGRAAQGLSRPEAAREIAREILTLIGHGPEGESPVVP
ncbi:MAG: undecaprenyldiphospho-muramoylpentapeptide beta-N-acetylglucosaminyltransferase [Gemmatimonadales bacterium]|nr:MAG: undecaprenyldiphospho-muramoylpentapeptide beta-N-acetylglucosaminyltransferase [Gemmatimonadales bacterium]